MMTLMAMQQQQQQSGGRDDDDDDDDWRSVTLNVIADLSVAVMTSLSRQQALQRQLDDQSRDAMTSQSRDVEWLRDWMDEERSVRREMMSSQELLQKTLVDCLTTANYHHQQQLLAAGKVYTVNQKKT